MLIARPSVIALILAAAFTTTAFAQENEGELKEVQAENIVLHVPGDWKEVETTSNMRAAQIQVPPKEAEAEAADLIVYYFGGGATGGVKANLDRWIGQFHEEGRDYKLSQGDCRAGEFVWLNISGTWKKPVGPPVAQQTEDRPGSRVVGVILIAQQDGEKDYYFIKFSGDDELVKQNEKHLKNAIGVKAESEKPLELENVEN